MFDIFKSKRGSEKPSRTVRDYCDAFALAMALEDDETAKSALYAAADVCDMRDSQCLSKLFCPDCPHGGLQVRSGQPGT